MPNASESERVSESLKPVAPLNEPHPPHPLLQKRDPTYVSKIYKAIVDDSIEESVATRNILFPSNPRTPNTLSKVDRISAQTLICHQCGNFRGDARRRRE